MKLLRIVIVIAFCFVLTSPAFGSVGVKDDGTSRGVATDINFSTGLDVDTDGTSVKAITVDTTEVSFVGADLAGAKVDPTVHATTDTTIITASESGKIYIATVATKFQLPAVADGLVYTFVTGSNVEVEIQVNTTPDTIVFSPPEIANGNGVIETAGTNTTGNTVVLYSDGSNWYVSVPWSATSAWTDGGEWIELNRGAQD